MFKIAKLFVIGIVVVLAISCASTATPTPIPPTPTDNLPDDERAVKARFESKMKEKPNCEIKISSVYTQNFIGLTEADRANGIKSRNTVWIDYIVRQGNEPWSNGTHYYTVENGKIDERSDPWYCK